jgi:hypothetical protein
MLVKKDIFFSSDVLLRTTRNRHFFLKKHIIFFPFILMLCFSLQEYDVFYGFSRNSIRIRIAVIVLYGVSTNNGVFGDALDIQMLET